MIIFPDNIVRRMAIFAVAVSLVAEITISPTNLAHRSNQVKASGDAAGNFQSYQSSLFNGHM